MTLQEIDSRAFAHAALRSERVRILAAIVVLLGIGAFVILREMVGEEVDGAGHASAFIGGLAVIALACAMEVVLLRTVAAARRTERMPPRWIWSASLAFECLLPTIAIFVAINIEPLGPYRSLSAPLLFTYLIFIILSTLRLRPRQCLLGGVISALGYLAAWTYTQAEYPRGLYPGAFTTQIYATYAFMIFACSGACALIAAQIRSHVIAALTEAQSQPPSAPAPTPDDSAPAQ